MEVVIAPAARSDMAGILDWTEDNFGPQLLKRYAKLIATAIAEVAANPELPGSRHRPEIGARCRTYHLISVANPPAAPGDRIRRPRHFLLYRVTAGNLVEIGRLLHDAMELKAHLPDDYRGRPE